MNNNLGIGLIGYFTTGIQWLCMNYILLAYSFLLSFLMEANTFYTTNETQMNTNLGIGFIGYSTSGIQVFCKKCNRYQTKLIIDGGYI